MGFGAICTCQLHSRVEEITNFRKVNTWYNSCATNAKTSDNSGDVKCSERSVGKCLSKDSGNVNNGVDLQCLLATKSTVEPAALLDISNSQPEKQVTYRQTSEDRACSCNRDDPSFCVGIRGCRLRVNTESLLEDGHNDDRCNVPCNFKLNSLHCHSTYPHRTPLPHH